MKKLFPFSFFGKKLKSVLLSSVIYALIIVAVRIAVSLIALIAPEIVNIVLNILRLFILVWGFSGITVSVLYAADCLDRK